MLVHVQVRFFSLQININLPFLYGGVPPHPGLPWFRHKYLIPISSSRVSKDKMSIREQTVYGKVPRNISVKSPEMLSYLARNCVILNDIVAALLPFTTLISSHRRIIYNSYYLDLFNYYYILYYIYCIPLVSSHHCLKNEACYTFIPLVSSHDGLKNETFKNRHSLFNTN